MLNYDKWNLYCRELPSPQSYIDFGFYYTISAALQRRVWINDDPHRLFPNNYTILCGPPAVGKGLLLKVVKSFLLFHKLNKNVNIDNAASLGKGSDNTETKATRLFQPARKNIAESPPLITVGSESTTWEALILAMANSYTGIAIAHEKKPYMYCSVCYCLEELSSLFKKKAEDVAKFLLCAYDCGDYTYDTIGRGQDMIKNPCLSLLAGTTPSFMQETFDAKFIADGFTSRVWYIYEYANRFNRAFFPPKTTEQETAKFALLYHIKKLTECYGKVNFTKEAYDFIDSWWKSFPQSERANSSPKLVGYYGRKQIHAMKLATAVHFAEANFDDRENLYVITLPEVKRAMSLLDAAEKKMHHALNFKGKNPLAEPSDKVIEFLRTKGEANFSEILDEGGLWKDLKKPELEEVINALTSMDRIESIKGFTGGIKGYRLTKKEKGNGNK